jgi:hypothetical protein
MPDATIFSPAITLASMAWRAIAGIDGDDNLTRRSHDSRVMILAVATPRFSGSRGPYRRVGAV